MAYSYQLKPTGVNYFQDGNPITNTQFGQGTGIDYGALETAANKAIGGQIGGTMGASMGTSGPAVDPNFWAMRSVDQPAQDTGGTGGYSGYASGGSTGGSVNTSGATVAQNNAYLDDQANQLRDLLSRTNTGLDQGMSRIGSEYGQQVGNANADKTKQLGVYQDNRVTQNTDKQNGFNTANKNANNGYRSLSQIIGRASGTGSSAFKDMLPNVIGTDLSSKRQGITDTYGANLRGIDKSQNDYLSSFEQVLQDLANQKKNNENTLSTGIETQRQGINSQLATNAVQKVQNNGGGYAQVQAAQAPYQTAIDNSRNTVQSFFDQFRPNYAPKTAAAATPDLAAYQTDRSTVNAQNQGIDSTNPYASLLRRRLTEGTVA